MNVDATLPVPMTKLLEKEVQRLAKQESFNKSHTRSKTHTEMQTMSKPGEESPPAEAKTVRREQYLSIETTRALASNYARARNKVRSLSDEDLEKFANDQDGIRLISTQRKHQSDPEESDSDSDRDGNTDLALSGLNAREANEILRWSSLKTSTRDVCEKNDDDDDNGNKDNAVLDELKKLEIVTEGKFAQLDSLLEHEED